MPTLEELRYRLLAERDRLRSDIGAVSDHLPEMSETREPAYGNHLADEASDTYEDEKNQALQAHLNGMLTKVEGALRRFDEGTYGKCEVCGKPIKIERLDALPYATTCLEHSSTTARRAA